MNVISQMTLIWMVWVTRVGLNMFLERRLLKEKKVVKAGKRIISGKKINMCLSGAMYHDIEDLEYEFYNRIQFYPATSNVHSTAVADSKKNPKRSSLSNNSLSDSR